jgi:uncharacterized YccA/Bax inhibitor family protein
VRSSNPVLSRLDETAAAQRKADGYAPAAPTGYPTTGYGQYGQPPVVSPMDAGRSMTLDDVVVRTIGLVLLVIATAAVSWTTLKNPSGLASLFLVGSSIAGIVLVFVISFKRITNPVVISLYAILQGILLGVVSREFERAYPGIVVQAVAGTLAVFLGMAVLYKFRIIRATPRFTRWVMGALIGVVGLSLINWVLYLFGKNLGIQYYAPTDKGGTLAIIFSLVCIGVGALTFILDFDAVEKGVRYGMPARYAWYCAFGLVVGLIYLYWQILRLLGYLRN